MRDIGLTRQLKRWRRTHNNDDGDDVNDEMDRNEEKKNETMNVHVRSCVSLSLCAARTQLIHLINN